MDVGRRRPGPANKDFLCIPLGVLFERLGEKVAKTQVNVSGPTRGDVKRVNRSAHALNYSLAHF